MLAGAMEEEHAGRRAYKLIVVKRRDRCPHTCILCMQCFLAPWSKGVIYHLSTLRQICSVHQGCWPTQAFIYIMNILGLPIIKGPHMMMTIIILSHTSIHHPHQVHPLLPCFHFLFFPTLCGNNDQDVQPYFLCNSLAFNLGLDWYSQIHLVLKVFVVNVVPKVVSPFIFGLGMNNWV